MTENKAQTTKMPTRKPLYLRLNAEDRAFIDAQAKGLEMDLNTYMARLIDQERIRVTMEQSLPLAVQAVNGATEKILMAHESMRHIQEMHIHTLQSLEKLLAVDTSYLNDGKE